MGEIKIEKVDHGSPLYWQAVALRQKILRTPLGMTFTPEELQNESNQIHVVATRVDAVIACVTLAPLDSSVCKLRQMAVDESQQGLGLGKKIVAWVENFACAAGYKKMALHARIVAKEFYSKLGYEQKGDIFMEVTIPHVSMQKSLAD